MAIQIREVSRCYIKRICSSHSCIVYTFFNVLCIHETIIFKSFIALWSPKRK